MRTARFLRAYPWPREVRLLVGAELYLWEAGLVEASANSVGTMVRAQNRV